MPDHLPPGLGPVAVHRWFARGEDWALHPWLGDRLAGLLAALDERIKSRREGPFQVEAPGGVLVGEILADPECLDPLARDRRPCILRVALVGARLSGPAQDRLLAGLRQLDLPRSPGIDRRLAVPVPVGPQPTALRATPGRAEACPRWRHNRWRVLAAALLGLAAAVAVPFVIKPGPRDDRPRTGLSSAGNGKDEGERSPDDPGVQGLLGRYRDVDHPYIAFLLAHPEALARARQGEEPSYESWRRQQVRPFRHALRPLPRRLRERVALWREPDESLRLLARQMRGLRQRWSGVDVEPAPTAFEEIERFFEYVTRPEALPPRAEFDHPGNVFLWRLPRDPVAAGRTFDSAEAVGAALRQLLERLRDGRGPSSVPQTAQDLLKGVEEELDYARWLQGQRSAGVVFADDKQEPGEAVTQGLGKFRAGP
jgi:hypothetical protein